MARRDRAATPAAGAGAAGRAPPAAGARRGSGGPGAAPPRPRRSADPDVTPVMPEVGGGVAVRWVDPAAPWLAAVGGDADVDDARRRPSSPGSPCATTTPRPTSSTTRSTRRCCSRSASTSTSRRPSPSTTTTATSATPRPPSCAYRLTDAPIAKASFWKQAAARPRRPPRRAAWRWRSRPTATLKLYGRPGETRRGLRRPLRARSPTSGPTPRSPSCATSTRPRRRAAQPDRRRRPTPPRSPPSSSRRASATTCCRRPGSILGGLLGGRRSRGGLLGQLGRAAGRTGKTSAAGSRVDAAQNKVARLEADLEDVEAELAEELTEIDARWKARRRAGRHDVDRPREDRRQGHPPDAGLDPGGLTPLPDLGAIRLWARSSRNPRRARPDRSAGGGTRTLTDGVLRPRASADWATPAVGAIRLRGTLGGRWTCTTCRRRRWSSSVDALDANLATMAAAHPGAALRPHVKAHKCTALAARQRAPGTRRSRAPRRARRSGWPRPGSATTCSSPTRSSIPAASRRCRARRRGPRHVAVDSEATIAAAALAGVRECVIDVDVGLPRCGCDPADAGRLADLARSKGLDGPRRDGLRGPPHGARGPGRAARRGRGGDGEAASPPTPTSAATSSRPAAPARTTSTPRPASPRCRPAATR